MFLCGKSPGTGAHGAGQSTSNNARCFGNSLIESPRTAQTAAIIPLGHWPNEKEISDAGFPGKTLVAS